MENHGKTMENLGKTMENLGKTMENLGKTMENLGKTMENPILTIKIRCESMVYWVHHDCKCDETLIWITVLKRNKHTISYSHVANPNLINN